MVAKGQVYGDGKRSASERWAIRDLTVWPPFHNPERELVLETTEYCAHSSS
jgi:hypothetical protein